MTTLNLAMVEAMQVSRVLSSPPPLFATSPVRMSSTRRAALSLLLHLSLLRGAQPRAPSPSPAPVPDYCAVALLRLSACATYAEAGSNLTRPKKGCCPALASLVIVEPACLCELNGSYGGLGVEVDTTRVLMLPTACHVDAPPASLCAVSGAPIPNQEKPARTPRVSVTPAVAPPDKNTGGSSLGEFRFAFLLVAAVQVIS